MYLNVKPRVTTATSLYITLFGRFGSTLVYLSLGWINLPYAITIGIVSSIGIYVAIKTIKEMIAKYNRPSLIIFVLAGILGISAIAVPVFNGINMIKE